MRKIDAKEIYERRILANSLGVFGEDDKNEKEVRCEALAILFRGSIFPLHWAWFCMLGQSPVYAFLHFAVDSG